MLFAHDEIGIYIPYKCMRRGSPTNNISHFPGKSFIRSSTVASRTICVASEKGNKEKSSRKYIWIWYSANVGKAWHLALESHLNFQMSFLQETNFHIVKLHHHAERCDCPYFHQSEHLRSIQWLRQTKYVFNKTRKQEKPTPRQHPSPISLELIPSGTRRREKTKIVK